jgi:predicted  nucleic acid-binding Zn-ribbon protein
MFLSNKKTHQALETLRKEVTTLRDQVSEQASYAATERELSRAVGERIAALETRISSMGSELSRQLHEVGNEIEELSKRADDSQVVEVIDALRSAQIKLAQEQARYEITFRQDLAALANQLLQRAV